MTVRDFWSMAAPSGGLARIARLVVLAVVLILSALAQAQESSEKQDAQSQPGQTDKGKKVKQPPAPLFRKHRRGIYRNAAGLEVIDATPQSPPLETDDPGVPDKGEFEINLTTHADLSRRLRTFDFILVDTNYGIAPKIFGRELPTQVKFEFPLAGAKALGEPMRVGIGPAKFGLKFNFYNDESKGIYLSFYPQIEFAVPGSDAAEKGLAEPGQTLILPLLVQKEFRYFTIVGNGVLDQPIHDPARDTTGTLGLAVGRAMTPHLAAMGEVRFTSTFDLKRERLAVMNFGLMYRLRDDVIAYAKVGHSIFSDEGFGHTYLAVGVKFELMSKK